jgi:hypothetical protein
MLHSSSWISGRIGRVSWGSLLLVAGFMACGGRLVEDEDAGVGAGGRTSTSASGGAAASCFGVPAAATTPNVCYQLPLSVIPADTNPNCIVSLEIALGYQLDTSRIRLFFPTSDGQRTEIPHVATSAACASSANGGWYATDPVSGTTSVVLCSCTCTLAHKYAASVDVTCS